MVVADNASLIAGFRRFNIIGTSGSGKTTFGRRLAQTLSLPYIEMDRLFWKPNWQQASHEEFSAQIRQALAPSEWVLDGNYDTRTQAIKWARTECVIWLDYTFPVVLKRSLGRSINRARSGQELWPGTGNVETFRKTFLSGDSILVWMVRQYPRNRRRYSALVKELRYKHIHFVRLSSPKDAEALIEVLRKTKTVS